MEQPQEGSNLNPPKELKVGTVTIDLTDLDLETSYLLSCGVAHPDSEERSKQPEEGSCIARSCSYFAKTMKKRKIVKGYQTLIDTTCREMDTCTRDDIKKRIQAIAKSELVGCNGLFILHLCGHGQKKKGEEEFPTFRVNRDRVSSSDICEWLDEVSCKAKLVLLFLDCCYSGRIAKNIIDVSLKSSHGAKLIAVATGGEERITLLPKMSHTTFTFFFVHFLNKYFQDLSQKKLDKKVFDDCFECVEALSSLYYKCDDSDCPQTPIVYQSQHSQSSNEDILEERYN